MDNEDGVSPKDVSQSPVIEVGGERDTIIISSAAASMTEFREVKSITDCICKAGFTGPYGGTCTACTTGKYKGTHGTALCTDCVAGSYSNTQGATTCTKCTTGSYSDTNGVTTCPVCTEGKYGIGVSQTAEASCASCPDKIKFAHLKLGDYCVCLKRRVHRSRRQRMLGVRNR